MPDSTLKKALKHVKHKLVLTFKPRKNVVYTQFYRFHHQYSVLCDKVIPFFAATTAGPQARPLEILLFGSSDGAEPYSLASVLQARCPDIRFRIRAFDIVPELVERAKSRRYTRADAYRSPFVTEDFVARTFDIEGDNYTVRESIASTVEFGVGSILDEPLTASLGQADLVFAQNFLFHLERPQARVAFTHLTRMLRPRAALFIDGMDTDMRIELTRRHALEPVDHLVREVHEDAYANHGNNWATHYWGRVPFSESDRDWLRKFGTVFLKSPSAS
jgi:chemotaxis protein methyltransferase CheR